MRLPAVFKYKAALEHLDTEVREANGALSRLENQTGRHGPDASFPVVELVINRTGCRKNGAQVRLQGRAACRSKLIFGAQQQGLFGHRQVKARIVIADGAKVRSAKNLSGPNVAVLVSIIGGQFAVDAVLGHNHRIKRPVRMRVSTREKQRFRRLIIEKHSNFVSIQSAGLEGDFKIVHVTILLDSHIFHLLFHTRASDVEAIIAQNDFLLHFCAIYFLRVKPNGVKERGQELSPDPLLSFSYLASTDSRAEYWSMISVAHL